jgi:hypothetical protein
MSTEEPADGICSTISTTLLYVDVRVPLLIENLTCVTLHSGQRWEVYMILVHLQSMQRER